MLGNVSNDQIDISICVMPSQYVSVYLENEGSNDMGVDGSEPIAFTYSPPIGRVFLVARIILYMEADANFDSEGFINLAALTNGIRISAAGVQLTNWKDNVDVVCDMFDLAAVGFSNVKRSMSGRWTFTKATVNKPLAIMYGQTFEALIRDDLSADGVIFRIKVQGRLIPADDN